VTASVNHRRVARQRSRRSALDWRAAPVALLAIGIACGGASSTPVDDPSPSPGPTSLPEDGWSGRASEHNGSSPRLAPRADSPAAARDPRWAAPLSRRGLPNLYRVSDHLYRGAQPEAAGFLELRALGIKTIVNLRSAHSDAPLIESSGVPSGAFQYVEIPMRAWDVDERELVAFLRMATDPARQPLFVHCEHGADRTGIAVASYRVAVEGWSPADAAAEMTGGGFGFHAIWSQLARQVRALDPARLRREAQIAAPPAAP
jgi:protein tyrosine phosphatase (PTP) superfamily phosphohydrolase (DUF442 family)